MLLEAINKKEFLTCEEIKELFKENKEEYIEVINDLLKKDILVEVKEQ